ncbi:MAG: hypothetical protein PHG65_08395, partial [Kiritimatiellae bacterium]|nr:hypothetical protein [Kiritimatiellia bacterium]
TRWYTVDASTWEDYILFSKGSFLTTNTVDDLDPAVWVAWENDWTDITRVIIEYGPSREGQDPVDLLVDDFRPYANTDIPDTIVDAPINDPSLLTNVYEVYTDAGIPSAMGYEVWSRPLITYRVVTNGMSSHSLSLFPSFMGVDTSYAGETAPEGSKCADLVFGTCTSWGIWATQHVQKISSLSSSSLHGMFSVDGDYAYCQKYGSIKVFDISDVDNPVDVGGPTNKVYYINDLIAEDGILYTADTKPVFASDPAALCIYDASVPSNTYLLSEYTNTDTLLTLDVEGDYLYAIESGCPRTMHVIDVSDPSNPVGVSTYDTYSDGALDLLVTNGYAYLTGQASGLQVLDVSNPAAISNVFTAVNMRGLCLLKHGDYMYQVDYCPPDYINDVAQLRVLQASTPTNIVKVSETRLSNNGLVYDLALVGNRLYASGDGRLRVIDITDPSAPRVEGYGSAEDQLIRRVAAVDDRILVLDYLGLSTYPTDQNGTSTNLSQYARGYLSFYVKSLEDLFVCIRAGGVESELPISECGWNGLYEWQKITIPMVNFRLKTTDLEHTYQPFALKTYSTPEHSEHVFVDDVRYTMQP